MCTLSSFLRVFLATSLVCFVFGCGGSDTGTGGTAGGGTGGGGMSGAGGGGQGGGGNAAGIEQVCIEKQCAKDNMCDPGAPASECRSACANVAGLAAAAGDRRVACEAAYETFFDCVDSLSCPDFLILKPGSAVDYPCRSTEYDQIIACGGDESLCFASCDVQINCGSGSIGCGANCRDLYNDVDNFSDACATALQALNSCVSQLSCGDFATYEARTGTFPCKTEQDALDGLMVAGCEP